jgi:hypothetical protein
MTKTLLDELATKQPDHIESFRYQDLGVVLQIDDSRASVKELLFSTELNGSKTLRKLVGKSPMWTKLAGNYENFMSRGGAMGATDANQPPCNYVASTDMALKIHTSHQGMGFWQNAVVEVETDLAVNSDDEEKYSPITATLSTESITINTATSDTSKNVTAYRRDGLDTIIGSNSSASVKTGRVIDFSVNNAGDSTDYRYKKDPSDGSIIAKGDINQPNIGITPAKSEEIAKFDISNKGHGYRPNYGGIDTRFIVYGRPKS